MSKELKPEWYMFQHEETGIMQPVEAQQVEWGFEELNPRLQNVGSLYTQSQLDAKSAYIEELSGYLAKIKPVLQTIAMDRGKGSKADVLFNELLALLNQSPATSLEQVSKPSHDWEPPDFSTCSKCGDKDWMADDYCSESKLANNLKEQP